MRTARPEAKCIGPGATTIHRNTVIRMMAMAASARYTLRENSRLGVFMLAFFRPGHRDRRAIVANGRPLLQTTRSVVKVLPLRSRSHRYRPEPPHSGPGELRSTVLH